METVNGALSNLQIIGDLGDESDLIVPVVGCIDRGIEPCSGTWELPELAHRTTDELHPAASNGVLQRFISDLRKDVVKHWRADGVPERSIPQTEAQAVKHDKHSGQFFLPAWTRDQVFVAGLEKTIRTTSLPLVPSLTDLHNGESEAATYSTELFLATGWSPIADGGRPPRSVRESSELCRILDNFTKSAEKAGDQDPWQLAKVGLVSEYTLNNGNETSAALTAPWVSSKGFDSVAGLNGEDMDWVHEIIQDKLHGTESRPGGFDVGSPHRARELAEQIWHRMTALDGYREGCRRWQPSIFHRPEEHRLATPGRLILPGQVLGPAVLHTTGGRFKTINPMAVAMRPM